MMIERMKCILLLLLSLASLASCSEQRFLPDNENLNYEGRVGSFIYPVLSWPGSSVEVKFKGSYLKIEIEDSNEESSINSNYYTILIDGQISSILKVDKSIKEYMLAEGLEPEIHTVKFFKRTESFVGTTLIKGFVTDAKELLKIKEKKRKSTTEVL